MRDTRATDGPAAGPRSRGRRRGRRWLIGLTVVALVLVAVFHLGGGWYFSSQIKADALAVDRSGPDRDVEVVAVGDGTVTLRPEGDESPLGRRDIYGLDWGDGYGQVRGKASASGGEVVRRLRVLAGEPPEVGDLVAADRSAFPLSDPSSALGREVQEVSYRSPLGKMPAWYVEGEGSTWVLLVHGHRSSRAEMLRAMQASTDADLPSLAIGYRNDDGAPEDPSGRYRFGATEWEDLDAAVRYAEAKGAADVVLVGSSMGGAVVASFLQHSERSDRVSAVVLDSPMLDFGETISHSAAQIRLPLVGGLPDSLVWSAKQLAAVRYELDWDEIDYLADSSWVTVPTLVLHGTDDRRVPLSTSEELADEHPELVRLETFRGAEHVGGWNQDPRRYRRTLGAFLRSPAA